MVIADFHAFRVPVGPHKADAPLIVHPDAMLTLSATLERFKPICRWDPQIGQGSGIVQHTQLSSRNGLDIGR
jgi:hypothetical protein